MGYCCLPTLGDVGKMTSNYDVSSPPLILCPGYDGVVYCCDRWHGRCVVSHKEWCWWDVDGKEKGLGLGRPYLDGSCVTYL